LHKGLETIPQKSMFAPIEWPGDSAGTAASPPDNQNAAFFQLLSEAAIVAFPLGIMCLREETDSYFAG
jgi:hypothetical protein